MIVRVTERPESCRGTSSSPCNYGFIGSLHVSAANVAKRAEKKMLKMKEPPEKLMKTKEGV